MLYSLSSFMLRQTVRVYVLSTKRTTWLGVEHWFTLSHNALTLLCFSIQYSKSHHLPWCLCSFLDWLYSITESFFSSSRQLMHDMILLFFHSWEYLFMVFLSEWNLGWIQYFWIRFIFLWSLVGIALLSSSLECYSRED